MCKTELHLEIAESRQTNKLFTSIAVIVSYACWSTSWHPEKPILVSRIFKRLHRLISELCSLAVLQSRVQGHLSILTGYGRCPMTWHPVTQVVREMDQLQTPGEVKDGFWRLCSWRGDTEERTMFTCTRLVSKNKFELSLNQSRGSGCKWSQYFYYYH